MHCSGVVSDLTSGDGSLKEDSKESCSLQMAIMAVFFPASFGAFLIKSGAVLFNFVQMSGQLLSLALVERAIVVLVVLVEDFIEPVFEFSFGWHLIEGKILIINEINSRAFKQKVYFSH